MRIAYWLAAVASFCTACQPRHPATRPVAPEGPVASVAPSQPIVESMQVKVTLLAVALSAGGRADEDANESAGAELNALADPNAGVLGAENLAWRPPRIATGLELSFRDGGAYRFADDTHLLPQVDRDGEERYRMVVTYQPMEGGGILGGPVDRLRSLAAATVHFDHVLPRIGLRFLGVTRIDVVVNGAATTVFDAGAAGVRTDPTVQLDATPIGAHA